MASQVWPQRKQKRLRKKKKKQTLLYSQGLEIIVAILIEGGDMGQNTKE